MIFIISSIIIAFIATINYRKGFLLYLLFQMIWFPDTQVFKIGDSSVNINFIMAVFFVFLYIIRSRGIIRLEGERFPYKVPMVFIAFSLFITCFSSLAGFLSEFVKSTGLVIMDILIVYLIWKFVKTKEDFIKTLDTNLVSLFLVSRTFGNLMLENKKVHYKNYSIKIEFKISITI